MELHLQKYRYNHNEYLIYDCNKEQYLVKNKEVRVMCSANFGIDVKNVLVVPVMEKGKIEVLTYNPDGTIGEADEATDFVFRKYLSDAGYTQDSITVNANRVSKIYLYDHFIMDNHIKCLAKQEA